MANFSKIALAMAAPAAVLAMSALPASALVYNFSADFGPSSGGAFNGSFTYNGNTGVFGPVSIITPASAPSFGSINYAGSVASVTGNTFTFTQGLSQLFFTTASPLVESNALGTPIVFTGSNISRGETQANGNVFRSLSGSVTPVPFEFSPVYGVALLGLGFGVSKIKNKFAKKAV
jgi:hypothetical protein